MNDASSSLFHQLQLGNSTNWGIPDSAPSFPNPNPPQQPQPPQRINGDAHPPFPDSVLDYPPPAPRPSIVELKRRYLSHLPIPRLVSTILDLELRGLRHDPSFGGNIWPPDLEAAVRDAEADAAASTGAGQEGSEPAGAGVGAAGGGGAGARPTILHSIRPPHAGPSHPKPVQRIVRGEGGETFHAGSNGLPNYEEMIVEALYEIGDEDGLQPKVIFDWIAERYPINSNFRPSAHQAIQKSHKRGRLEKTGNKYRLNPDWDGTILTKKPTRRPKAAADPSSTSALPSQPSLSVPPPPLPMPTTSMSIEAALSMLVNSTSTGPPIPIPTAGATLGLGGLGGLGGGAGTVGYTPPTEVRQSLNSLAQQFAARSRRGRVGDLPV